MNQLLASLPKGLIALIAVVLGIAFILFSDPPRTLCDAQVETFKEQQKGFLYLNPQQKSINTTGYVRHRDECKVTNAPGGCYEYFRRLSLLMRSLRTVSSECQKSVSGLREVREALWESLELMTQLAWGTEPPATYHEKFGWLDQADVALFCRMREWATQAYGEGRWTQFREKMLKELPGTSGISREQAWGVMILSENCLRYP